MKKSIINRNYSLLILILLILFITYINIPISTNMRGGGEAEENPYDKMTPEDLDKNLMEHDSVYKFLNTYYNIYLGILIILLGVAIYFIYDQANLEGLPGVINPALSWDNEGATFLNTYFGVSREKNKTSPPGSSGLNSNDLAGFDDRVADMIKTVRPGVDLFCNIIAPCNICTCKGPDPSYAGLPSDAPIITYEGVECGPPEQTEHFIEGATAKVPVANPAKELKKQREKLGMDHRLFGTIPNCCCHLFNTVGLDIAKITDDDVLKKFLLVGSDKANEPIDNSDLTKFLSVKTIADGVYQREGPGITSGAYNNKTQPIGMAPEVGCEPLEEIKPLNTPSGSVLPNNGNFALAMFQACLSNKPIEYKGAAVTTEGEGTTTADVAPDSSKPNAGKSPLELNKKACALKLNSPDELEVSLKLDRGMSKNFMHRNKKLMKKIDTIIKNAKLNITNVPFDIRPYLGKIPNSTNAGPGDDKDFIRPWAGGPWPTDKDHIAFKGNGVVTEYYYKYTDTNVTPNREIIYELKIDNYLREIYGFPVKTGKQRNESCVTELVATTDTLKLFLDTGLKPATLGDSGYLNRAYKKLVPSDKTSKSVPNRNHIFYGAYIFP